MTDKQKKKRYSDMMLTYLSFRDSGELDEFVEKDMKKLKKELAKAKETNDFTKVNQLKAKLERECILSEDSKNGIIWRWKK